jgi:hypothetical protein
MEGTREGMVTVEVSAKVSRPCTVGTISSSFIDRAGQPLPGALEANAALDRAIGEPAEYVLAMLVWKNWCSEHGDSVGPYGVTITVNGSALVVPRLASIPFCRDRQARLRLEIEIAPEPTPLVVPGTRLDATYSTTARTWANFLDHFVIYADGQVCGILSLADSAARNSNGDAVFRLGLPRQPAVCSTAGALVCLEMEARPQQGAWTMFKRLTLEPGGTLTFDNFSPDPPRDPGPQPTCSVPNPRPRAPAAGTYLPSSASSSRGWLAVALGATLAAGGLALGLAVRSRRRD